MLNEVPLLLQLKLTSFKDVIRLKHFSLLAYNYISHHLVYKTPNGRGV
ncbi:hypothetical protein PSEUDO9AG_70237 [Pseudomonas sp. 9Ag]|nr:hypothetical protein PSEUDO9AG_70237 [Pseudomonas sp. 9Ag]